MCPQDQAVDLDLIYPRDRRLVKIDIGGDNGF